MPMVDNRTDTNGDYYSNSSYQGDPAFYRDKVTNGCHAVQSQWHGDGRVGVSTRQRRLNVFLVVTQQPTQKIAFLDTRTAYRYITWHMMLHGDNFKVCWNLASVACIVHSTGPEPNNAMQWGYLVPPIQIINEQSRQYTVCRRTWKVLGYRRERPGKMYL